MTTYTRTHTQARKLPHTLISLFSVNIFTFSLDSMTLITHTLAHRLSGLSIVLHNTWLIYGIPTLIRPIVCCDLVGVGSCHAGTSNVFPIDLIVLALIQ